MNQKKKQKFERRFKKLNQIYNLKLLYTFLLKISSISSYLHLKMFFFQISAFAFEKYFTPVKKTNSLENYL